jgi:putative spermidine/putrescine transport system permease protein
MTSLPTARLRSTLLLLTPVVVTTVLFVAPILTMASESVYDAGGATLEHYRRFFGDRYYLEALGTTIGTSILVMLITAVLSFPLAYTYWQASGRLRSLLVILLLSPFYANVVVKVFGWMVILPSSFLNSYFAVLLVSVHRAMPFMVLAIASALARIEPELLESARTCGAASQRVFRTVVLPLSLPGLVSGGIVVFSLTVAAFVVPQLIGGASRGRFLPVLLYQQITIAQNWGFGAAIAMILLVTSLLTIATGNRLARSGRLGHVMSEGDGG